MKILGCRLRQRLTAAQIMLCMILVATTTLGLTTPARAAGIVTHAEAVERAIELVDEQAYPDLVAMLKEYQAVVNYGSMFPDWAYAIFDADLAEVLHDTCTLPSCGNHSFRDALADYLLPAFRNPQSADDRKAIAFLFGLISHQEMDNPWHFSQKGSPLALEQAISFQNYKLGTVLEFVVELFVARDLLWFENLPEFWIPGDALHAAYNAVGRDDISVNDLNGGKVRQAIVYSAEVVAGFYILSHWVWIADLPLINFLETYPSGGLDDGARHTAEAWQQTWDGLSTYTPVTSTGLSPAQPDGNR